MDSKAKINHFARRIMWRKRLFALQDLLAWGLLIGGFTSAALIFYIRWKAIQTPVWLVALVVFGAIFGALFTRWSIARANQTDAGFLIDEKLNLDDRFATSQAILLRSETPNEVEMAVLEDAANRVEEIKPASILPYRVKKVYALSAIAALMFTTAVMIPQKSLPGGEELVKTQADIQSAGEQLEKTSTEIEKFVPPDTITANLAKEQAELGRSLRRSTDTRAQALKKLSMLEDRIKQRHEELKSTRADEIVALAQRRMGTALAQMSKRDGQQKAGENGSTGTVESDGNGPTGESKSAANKASDRRLSPNAQVNQTANGKVAKGDRKNPKEGQTAANQSGAKQEAAQKGAQKNLSQDNPQVKTVAKQNQTTADQKQNADPNAVAQKSPSDLPEGRRNPNSQGDVKNSSAETTSTQTPDKNSQGEKTQSEAGQKGSQQENAPPNQTGGKEPPNPDSKEQTDQDASNPLTTAVAEQTAKALPQLSEQLLKKAQELRDGKISAEDIKRLAASAGQLAKELAPIAQSKEFQKSLEELAKQVNPKQLEEVARALMQDEKLQRELKAAAKLLWENRQVKDMVAGLAKTGAEIEADFNKQRGEDGMKSGQVSPLIGQPGESIALNSKPGKNEKGQPKGFSTAASESTRAASERQLAGQGKAATINGQMQNRPGGDYIFSGGKPGQGAMKVPYSSAYPQYRRQAERTVERSRVPAQMRLMIRNYFDAINPNGKN